MWRQNPSDFNLWVVCPCFNDLCGDGFHTSGKRLGIGHEDVHLFVRQGALNDFDFGEREDEFAATKDNLNAKLSEIKLSMRELNTRNFELKGERWKKNIL